MGVKNLRKLIDAVQSPKIEPDLFDSILLDAQSYLYIAIEQSLETNETHFFIDVVNRVWNLINSTIQKLLSFVQINCNLITIIIALDGDGVPMKWPTQRDRRNKTKFTNRKAFYSCSLFGNNKLSSLVKKALETNFEHFVNFPSRKLHVIISGSDMPGEGEHKLFQIAEQLQNICRRPIVASVDQDVFILSLLRLDRYEKIQIYRYEEFYDVTILANKSLPYNLLYFTTCSFLFGNDFSPAIIGISQTNAASIHFAMSQLIEEKTTEENPPLIMYRFLENIRNNIRFIEATHVSRQVVVSFWLTYLWVLDYYQLRHFSQKFMLNDLFDNFNRDMLLTALFDYPYSYSTFTEATNLYRSLQTQPYSKDVVYKSVFTDENVLENLKPYWLEEKDEKGQQPSNLCKSIQLTKK